MDMLLSVMIGISLAAAAGFRVFVPLLVLSIAAKAGAVSLDPSLAFIASTPALVALSIATIAEIGAYKIPWIDHALDTVTTPAAVVAGTILAGSQFSFIGQQGELLQWAAAIIAGGSVAAAVQTTTVATRGASTITTGGIANPFIAVIESFLAVLTSILAIIVPVLVILMLLSLGSLAMYLIWRWTKRRNANAAVNAGRTADVAISA
jgi:hypothetical protein